jgi:hypothetical protein
MTRAKGMESTCIPMGLNIRVSGSKISRKDMDLKLGQMELSTKVATKMA